MLFFAVNLMRQMYTRASSVGSIVAKKGPKIAVCAMASYSFLSLICLQRFL